MKDDARFNFPRIRRTVWLKMNAKARSVTWINQRVIILQIVKLVWLVRFKEHSHLRLRLQLRTDAQSRCNIFDLLNELMKFFKLTNHLHSTRNYFKSDLHVAISRKTWSRTPRRGPPLRHAIPRRGPPQRHAIPRRGPPQRRAIPRRGPPQRHAIRLRDCRLMCTFAYK
jgi:hypothetical protein